MLDPTLYHTIVGSLVYLTITYINITYVVHIVSQFVTSPITIHWVILLCILWCLWSSVFQSLLFLSTSSLELRDYSDANLASDPKVRKSIVGFYIFLWDSLISWKSKKQTIISWFSIKAEYYAMTSTTSERVLLHWLLIDMGVSLYYPTPMYCNNKSVIQIAHNSIFHERTKHIEIGYHLTHHYL